MLNILLPSFSVRLLARYLPRITRYMSLPDVRGVDPVLKDGGTGDNLYIYTYMYIYFYVCI